MLNVEDVRMNTGRTSGRLVAVAFAAAVAPTAVCAQSTNDLLLGVFRLGVQAFGNSRQAPKPQAPVEVSEQQRKALEAQIDEALKNEPEEERARKKAALLAEFDRATQRANEMARQVNRMEAEQAEQPVLTVGDVVDVAVGGTPGRAMRQAEAVAGDPRFREGVSRTMDAAARSSGAQPSTKPLLRSLLDALKGGTQSDQAHRDDAGR